MPKAGNSTDSKEGDSRLAAAPGRPVQTAANDHSHTLLFIAAIAAALVLLAIQVRHYFPFMADDAFISLRYSRRLIEGKGLTWSDDQRVEGYTNLLWVLLCAALGKLGMNLVLAARLLGVAGMLSAFAALVVYIRENVARDRWPIAAVYSLIPFALSSPIAVWMIGGLEQPLLIGLLAWTLVLTARFFRTEKQSSLVSASLLLAGVVLTRADGFTFPLLIFAAVAIAQLRRRRTPAPALLVLIAPAVAYTSQLAFRLRYYHEWLPNTAYIKVSFTLQRLVEGLRYVASGSAAEFGVLVLAVIGCIQLWRAPAGSEAGLGGGRETGHSLATLYLVIGIGTGLYLVLIGGDIFPAVRHFLPVILVLCFAAVHSAMFAYDSRNKLRPGTAVALICLALLVVWSRHQAVRAVYERWEWQDKELGLYIKQHFPPSAVVASDAAGATPFYSELQAIDPLGLNDRHIAHMKFANKGHGALGHEFGDGKYVLDHKPDIILFGASGEARPHLPSDFMIFNDPRFQQDYELQYWSFDRPAPWTSEVYVRRPDR